MDKQTRFEILHIVTAEQKEIQQHRALYPTTKDRSDMEIAADIWLGRERQRLELDCARKKDNLMKVYNETLYEIQVDRAREAEDRKEKANGS